MAEKILIVDDDLDTLKLVGLLLQRKGYQIVAATHGSQGIEKAKEEKPELILLDVMMPDMDGLEVLQHLSQIPIIMFSAKTQVEDRVSGFDAGADDYLAKPAHPAELIARVKAILARTTRQPTSIARSDPSQRGKIIGVISAKGGLGVSTLVVNLGFTIQELSQETVTIVDLRPGNGSLGLMLGYSSHDTLSTLLEKEAQNITLQDVQNALIRHDNAINLIPASYQPSDTIFNYKEDNFSKFLPHLSELSQYTILDLGSAIPPAVDKVIEFCDQIIVVVEPVLSSAIQTKALLDELSLKVLGLGRITVTLVNRIRSEMQMPSRQVQDRLGHAISVVFTPVPELAYQASTRNSAMVTIQRDTLTSQQFAKLAQFVLKQGVQA